MKDLKRLMELAKKKYDSGGNPFPEIRDINDHCQELLKFCTFRFRARSDDKDYWVFSHNGSDSRPVNKALMLAKSEFDLLLERFVRRPRSSYSVLPLSAVEVDCLLYTAITNFCCCFDLYQRTSRKTPGTFFEILLGSFISDFLVDYSRKKFIKLPGLELDGEDVGESEDSVSTDIVFEKSRYMSFIFPAKITTRERVVQPFAHQRIIDSAFGSGKYLSFLLCVSEMQLDKDTSVHAVCVPGTIKLFQKYLAQVGGIYYLDPPKRYLANDVKEFVVVSTVGALLTEFIHRHIHTTE